MIGHCQNLNAWPVIAALCSRTEDVGDDYWRMPKSEIHDSKAAEPVTVLLTPCERRHDPKGVNAPLGTTDSKKSKKSKKSKTASHKKSKKQQEAELAGIGSQFQPSNGAQQSYDATNYPQNVTLDDE
ncbi:hypothetical protein CIB48_g10824 [Xylaria polymorpha]|nr:hypothetical protein CIB48_g10824 [Xylaria polymorpha]